MKTNNIKIEITVNFGNYENVKLAQEVTPEQGEDITELYLKQFQYLRSVAGMMQRLHLKQEGVKDREPLTENHPRFAKAKEALANGKTTIEEIETVFLLTDDIKKKLLTK